jgi:Gas vesicle synthesis protein GvpL/GvpF
VIELLAITDDPGAPPPPLRLVPAGPVGVVVGPAPEGEVDAEALWERESLLEDLMGERALLPIRYGTRVEDDAAAAAAVEPRGAELAAALERVRGAVEVSVRAVAREGEPADVRAIHDRLSGLAREHARLDGSEPLRAAYLVDRAAVEDFVAAVRELQHEQEGLSILCTGPWPPYSFAEPR